MQPTSLLQALALALLASIAARAAQAGEPINPLWRGFSIELAPRCEPGMDGELVPVARQKVKPGLLLRFGDPDRKRAITRPRVERVATPGYRLALVANEAYLVPIRPVGEPVESTRIGTVDLTQLNCRWSSVELELQLDTDQGASAELRERILNDDCYEQPGGIFLIDTRFTKTAHVTATITPAPSRTGGFARPMSFGLDTHVWFTGMIDCSVMRGERVTPLPR